MKKATKIIIGVCAAAYVAGLIPYHFEKDEETGAREIRSLLWAWRKTPGDGKFRYDFAMPPSGLDA